MNQQNREDNQKKGNHQVNQMFESSSGSGADLLRDKKELIIYEWEKQVVQIVPAAQDISVPVLQDSLPLFLDRLIKNLQGSATDRTNLQEEKDMAREHGEQRSEIPGYDLKQVIQEYQILRKVIFRILHVGTEFCDEEAEVIHETIDTAIRDASSEFFEQRKRSDEKNRNDNQENEARFRAIVEGVKDHAIILTDMNGLIVDWNSGAEKITGFLKAEVVGQSAKLIFTPDDQANEIDKQEMITAREKGHAEDNRWHVKKNGTLFFATGAMNPLRIKSGELIGYIKVFRDSTQQELMNVERDQFFQVPNLLLCIVDRNSKKFVRMTKSWETLLGYTIEEMMDRTWIDFLHPDDVDAKKVHEPEDLQGSLHSAYQNRFRHKNGSYRWLQWNTSLVKDAIYCAVQDITERKHWESRLRKNYEVIREMVDTLPVLFWWTGEGGKGNFFNKKWYEYTGLTENRDNVEEIESFQSLIHPDDLAHNLKVRQEAVKNRTTARFEERIRRHDGQYRWHLVHATPILGKDGSLIRWYANSTDIHDQKLFEQRLKESEAQIRAFTEAMPQMAFMADKSGSPIFQNQRIYEYFDLPSRNLEAWRAIKDEVLHPDERELIRQTWRESIQCGKEFEMEYRLKRHDGQWRWHLSRAVPVYNEQNEVTHWYGTITDIHQQKLTEQALKVTEARMNLATLATGIGVWEYDIATKVTWRSYTHDLVWGYKAKLDHWDVSDALKQIYPEDVSWFQDEFSRAIQREEMFNLEIRIVWPDRTLHWISVKGQVMKGPDGQAIKVIGTNQDITERKEIEEELNRARYQAEAASRSKSSFLANMSHEIRTPMTAVLGFAELLKDPELSEEERADSLGRIESSGRALLALIDDILDISKIEAGKLDIQKSVFSPISVVSEVVAMMRIAADRKKIQLQCKTEPGFPNTVSCDPARLRQILVNLIGNAIKFTHQGKVVISLKTEDEKYLIVEVCDTGIGISEAERSKLFHAFAQADESISRNFGGTGLGLMLSKRIAEKMGGDLWLSTSEKGKGSTFKLKVTADPMEFELDERASFGPRSAGVERRERKELLDVRVLVAEDILDNRVLMKHYLEKAGAKVEFAIDGQEAIEKARTGNFQIVLMDIQMPICDGLEATRILRTKGFQKPIVALTAHAMQEELGRSLAAGCNAHITKPITKEKLVSTILNFIKTD